MPEEKVEEIEATEIDADVAKALEGDDTQSDSTPEDKSSSKEETSTRTETSKKTEEEETEESKEEEVKEEKKEEVSEDDTRFDKNPRWKKMIEDRDNARSERDNALSEAQSLRELKTKLDGFQPEELGRLKEVGKLLKSNPELAKKVQEVIDGHDFRNAEVKGEINKISSELQRLEQERVLEKYDNTVNKLMSDNKVSDDLKPIVSELLETRVIKKQIPLEKVGNELKTILKQIDTFNRKTLASRVETKTVPPSPSNRGKAMTTKKESADTEDIIGELAEGLKASKE